MTLARVVFAGTPEFSVPCLQALQQREVEIVAVYTQPDRVAGRGKKLQQSPVKQFALTAGLDIFQPESFKHTTVKEQLKTLQADIMVVVAYGLILPQSVLDIPRLGCVNIHASLLPRWRGAAPIQRAIEAGDSQSGVCLMQMEKGLDTGPVLSCKTYQLRPNETGGSLHDTLSTLGAALLSENLDALLNRELPALEQATAGVSYAQKLSKQETQVDWTMPAQAIVNKIHAFNPWPVVSTGVQDRAIRLLRATVVDSIKQKGSAGEIVALSPAGIHVCSGDGVVGITELQKPGGKILSAGDFLNGFPLEVGQEF